MNDLTPTRAAGSQSAQAELGAMNWLRGELDRLFEEFAIPGRSLLSYVPRLVSPVPAVELVDTGSAYKLTAELAGLRRDAIGIDSISVNAGSLLRTLTEVAKAEGSASANVG